MINNYKITDFLANKELVTYFNIAKHVGNQEFILTYKDALGDFATFIADQNTLSEKAKSKLPSFYKAGCIYTSRSLEQCTAEDVATYKAGILKGNTLLSLASGLGADDASLSGSFKKIFSVESDEELNIIARHNFALMGLENIERITSTAEKFLQHNQFKFDAVYIDPDRRQHQERQILLSQHRPNVIELIPELLLFSKEVWIKCSPLYDVDMALKEVSGICEIYCISLKGEVKEMLLRINTSIQPLRIYCVDIGSRKTINCELSNEQTIPETAELITGYFYEAGAALVKMRKHHPYASINKLQLIDSQVPFYTGEQLIENFLGKTLSIKQSFAFNPKQIKIYLKNLNLRQINIKARGVKTDVAMLFKKLEMKEGGNEFLFICPFRGKNIVIHCTPV